ncbi:MAG: linear amide C-N hydrolase [Xanthobacter sp.]
MARPSPWHMTNMNNYAYLRNVEYSTSKINGHTFQNPDCRIATIGLPASNTSVSRLVRAIYYSHFAEKVDKRTVESMGASRFPASQATRVIRPNSPHGRR